MRNEVIGGGSHDAAGFTGDEGLGHEVPNGSLEQLDSERAFLVDLELLINSESILNKQMRTNLTWGLCLTDLLAEIPRINTSSLGDQLNKLVSNYLRLFMPNNAVELQALLDEQPTSIKNLLLLLFIKSPETYLHQLDVLMLVRVLRDTGRQISDSCLQAALLHDLGKLKLHTAIIDCSQREFPDSSGKMHLLKTLTLEAVMAALGDLPDGIDPQHTSHPVYQQYIKQNVGEHIKEHLSATVALLRHVGLDQDDASLDAVRVAASHHSYAKDSQLSLPIIDSRLLPFVVADITAALIGKRSYREGVIPLAKIPEIVCAEVSKFNGCDDLVIAKARSLAVKLIDDLRVQSLARFHAARSYNASRL